MSRTDPAIPKAPPFVELCAGAAACALHAIDPALKPPIPWRGGKRRLAAEILHELGVVPGKVRRIVLVEAGSWGWVWPGLLGRPGAAAVSLLRQLAAVPPMELHRRLVAIDPGTLPPEDRLVQWLWLQARSPAGAPVWWGGGRWVKGEGDQPADDRGEDRRWAGGGHLSPATIADRIAAIRKAVVDWGGTIEVLHRRVQDVAPIPGARVVFDPPYGGRSYPELCDRRDVLKIAKRWRDAGCVVGVCEGEGLPLVGWEPVQLMAPARATTEEWLTLSHRSPGTRRMAAIRTVLTERAAAAGLSPMAVADFLRRRQPELSRMMARGAA